MLSGINNMNDNKTTLHELKELVFNFVKERNWISNQKPRDVSISICLEAAELLELFQWYDKNDKESLEADGKFELLEEELADVLIYCLTMAHMMNIDIFECIARKLEKNAIKHPVKT